MVAKTTLVSTSDIINKGFLSQQPPSSPPPPPAPPLHGVLLPVVTNVTCISLMIGIVHPSHTSMPMANFMGSCLAKNEGKRQEQSYNSYKAVTLTLKLVL